MVVNGSRHYGPGCETGCIRPRTRAVAFHEFVQRVRRHRVTDVLDAVARASIELTNHVYGQGPAPQFANVVQPWSLAAVAKAATASGNDHRGLGVSKRDLEEMSFLDRVHRLSFGDGLGTTAVVFVDEFELTARHDAEKGGAPDYAILSDQLVWLIELKTERGSHRASQVPSYFDLAHHHYPAAQWS